MRDRPTIVTLCGSTRFRKEFEEIYTRLGLEGKIVLSVVMFGHHTGLDMGGPVKKMLDELHKRKIDASDEIFVVNPVVIVCGLCGKPSKLFTELSQETECCRSKKWEKRAYIGESTRSEIEYAWKHKKKVYYLEE